jgi:hypothetical protein
VTYLVAYTAWRDRTPGSRGGGFKRVADANALPVGPAHAVEEGSDVALCGTYVGSQPERREWPPGPIGRQCAECRELVGQSVS